MSASLSGFAESKFFSEACSRDVAMENAGVTASSMNSRLLSVRVASPMRIAGAAADTPGAGVAPADGVFSAGVFSAPISGNRTVPASDFVRRPFRPEARRVSTAIPSLSSETRPERRRLFSRTWGRDDASASPDADIPANAAVVMPILPSSMDSSFSSARCSSIP